MSLDSTSTTETAATATFGDTVLLPKSTPDSSSSHSSKAMTTRVRLWNMKCSNSTSFHPPSMTGSSSGFVNSTQISMTTNSTFSKSSFLSSYPSIHQIHNSSISWSANLSKTLPSNHSQLATPTRTFSNCSGTFSITTHGTGLDYANSCASVKNLLHYATPTDPSMPCFTDIGILHPSYDTILGTYTTDIVSAYYETETLCDGIPRAIEDPTSILSLQATITRAHWARKTGIEEAFASNVRATPNLRSVLGPCSIRPKACAQLWRDWELYYVSKYNAGLDDGSMPDFPFCEYVTTDCNKCTIHGEEVRMLYFPVTEAPPARCPAAASRAKVRRLLPPVVANGT